jgi:hypothetical protein
MQITDQQFIDAMHKAVEIAGCNNSAPGRYRDVSGAPSCVIGFALAQINRSLVPWDNTNLAKALLLAYGCSDQVAVAGHYAQAANDLGCLWGVVVAIFDEALELARAGVYEIQFGTILEPKIIQARAKANEYRDKVREEYLQKFSPSKKIDTMAIGGWLAPGEVIAFPPCSVTVNPALLAQGIEPPHVKSAFSLSA